MNILLKTKNIINYEKSLEEDLKKIQEIKPKYEIIEYFINIVINNLMYDVLSTEKPKVIIVGTNIPEEIVYASGNVPYWIMGGSLSTVAWSDSLVPRDTDSISRSLLGVLLNDNFEIAKEALIIVPLINDSFKKITFLLKNEGYKIHYVCVPSIKNEFYLEEWNNQIDLCIGAIKKHTKKIITKKSLNKAYKDVGKAKEEIRKFLKLTSSDTTICSIHKLMILYSYYAMKDINEWTENLKKLNEEIVRDRYISQPNKYRANVILLGSPIYFPNFKIPFLLEDIGLNLVGAFDYSTQKFNIPQGRDFQEYINNCFSYDISSAYANNDTIYDYLEKELIKGELKIEGVVYHIIKGQLDFDFELDRFEQLFAKYDIPVFRLETDYNYQDIEQLRIRMEAFSEVLEQKRYVKEKKLNEE